MSIAAEFQNLFAFLKDTATAKALDQDIPVAGTALQAVPAALFAALQQQIATALNGVGDDANAIANAINGIPGGLITASAAAGVVTITIAASDSVTLDTVTAALDLGISGVDFGLEGNASFTPQLGAALSLALTYDTNAATPGLVISNGNDALKLDFDVMVAASGKADLGLLEVNVTDGNTTTPEIALDLIVDIAAGPLSGLDASDVTVEVNGGINLDLKVRTDILVLPDLVADFVVDWSFAGSISVAPTAVKFDNIGVDISSMVDLLADVMAPILGFTRTFPLGGIIDGLTAPVPEPFASVLRVIDVDRMPLGGGDGKVNLLDFVAIYYEQQGNEAALEAISLFAEAMGIIQMLTGGANGDLAGIVKLGDLDFTTGAVNFTPNADAPDDADGFLALAKQFEEAIEAIQGLIKSVQSSLAGGFSDTVGLAFPILDNPLSVVSLFLPGAFPGAGPVTFVEYDLPALAADVVVGEFFFPILGPIGISLGGSLRAGIDFKIAYDSTGLTNPGSDGFTIDDLFKGLVLKPSSPGDPVGFINSEIFAGVGGNLVVVKAFIEGGLRGAVNAYFPNNELRYHTVADGCIFDPISGQIGADLRARITVGFGPFAWTARKTLAETTLVDFSFGCDGSGTVSTDPGKGLAAIDPANSGNLLLNAGTRAGLRSINGTPGTDLPSPDGETYRIGNTVDANGVLIAGALTVSAFGINETYGSPGAPILTIGGNNGANFGQGDDALVIAASVQQAAVVSMGAGDDFAVGGAGNDILRGDAGFDHLIGGAGNDQLFGGAGDDTLDGGLGADLLDGGAGNDQVSYENSAVGVVFNKAPDASGAFIGEGGEAEGDRLVSIEYIIGSNHNDILRAHPTQGSTLEGRAGNDALIGGTGNDFLLGGIGGDYLDGGAGRDGTSYITSFGAVRIDLLFNNAAGGDAQGDKLISIEDVQGSMFDDLLYGDNSANRLDGSQGDDIIEGRRGADILTGGPGNDIIYAGADGDLLSGGDGIDLLSYRSKLAGVVVNLATGDGGGSDQIGWFDDNDVFHLPVGGLSDFENLEGSHFGDTLIGDNGNNTIWGLNGNDVINGGAGNDTLIGGAGADQLTGGDGIDWADYTTSSAGVTVSLVSGVIGSGGDAQGDTLNTIENLRGSDLADTLTGNGGDNVFDPRLSLFGIDKVFGGGGSDTLFLDYSRGDYGTGATGGFDLGSLFNGDFRRSVLNGPDTLDGVDFQGISRLIVIGTFKDDTIYGGRDDDHIYTGGGDDLIYAGLGDDVVYAEDGDDVVFHGTGADRNFVVPDFGLEMGSATLYGGRGIDTLNISLIAETADVVITGSATPDEEFTGTNLNVSGGSFAAEFEKLGTVITGLGKDQVTQLGQVDNHFDTGWDVDIIKPGLGIDTVYGGFDFDFGVDGSWKVITLPGEPGKETTLTAFVSVDHSTIRSNPGDLLELDYSDYAGTGGITGSVSRVLSDLTLAFPSETSLDTYFTNEGTYTSGDGSTHLTFGEIERVKVTGSDGDDVLVGTYDPAAGIPGGLGDDSLVTVRGDDTLYGGAGNDTLIGNSGDDTLYGGDGDDVICGEYNPFVNAVFSKYSTVDTLYGGAGADLFVLGAGETVFYTNQFISESSDNRAIIKDFDFAEDKIQLLGTADDYRVTFTGTTAHISLYEGDGSQTAEGFYELIADIENAAGFSLTGNYVKYVTPSDPFPTAPPSPASFSALSGLSGFSSLTGFSALASGWITQTNDRDTLLNTLFGGAATGLTTLGVTLNGDGRAFGTVSGDPFGLGQGIILSTGKVVDLEGVNERDGGFFRVDSPDLSTDFGLTGSDGDTIQFTYTFEKAANASVDTLIFDFIMFSEEFREWGGSPFNDSFKILLNGVNLATLSDGTAATINNMMPSPFGPVHPDLILNPVGTGPLADQIRADAYTKTLQFAGRMQDGINTLTIEVKDVGDGRYDSGIIVKGGTFKAVASTGTLLVGGGGGGSGGMARIVEGDGCFKVPMTIDPGLRGNLIAPLVITVTPSADIDLGNGPGVAKVVTVNPGDPLTFELCVTAPNDRKSEGDEFGTISFAVKSSDPAYDGLPIAPLVLEIIDALPRVTLVADQSLEGSKSPVAFGDGVTLQGFDLKGKAAELGYGDGGVGVIGKGFGKKGEPVFRDEVDFRGNKSERLVIAFDNAASDISLTLGQFYANESKRSERASYTAYDAEGEVIATGILVAGKAAIKVSEAVWRFDLGLNGVARIELEAADLYEGGKKGNQQSDFTLQSLTYAPTVDTADPAKNAITGTNGKDVVNGVKSPYGQPSASEGVDVIAGLAGKDKLFGLGGNDTLDGGAGNDRLRGGDGDDLIIGGAGKDKVTGGPGADNFLFNAALSNKNLVKITDFKPGEDLIVLDHRVFTKLGPGPLPSKAFFKGAAANDGSDRVGYDKKTGEVHYDKNGDRDGGDVVFAMLKPGLKLGESDFVVI